MNLDLAKASPLDELRNQSGYFPNISRKNVEMNLDISSNHDDCQSIFQGTNQSVFSFETIQTTERLLDRLDLSAEDEMFLQQALKEEEEKIKEFQLKEQKGPVLCMPASKFPSLRTKTLTPSKEYEKSSIAFTNLRGDSSSSKVEQHFPAKSRYSYLVEEDIDVDFQSFPSPSNGKGYLNVYGQQLPNMNKIRNHSEPINKANIAINTRRNGSSPDLNIIDIEKYRMDNAKLAHYYDRLTEMNSKLYEGYSPSPPNALPNKLYEQYGMQTPMRDDSVNRNNSNGSTTTSFNDTRSLVKRKTDSSMESDNSSKISSAFKDGSRELNYSTPIRTDSSSTTEGELMKEMSREPTPAYKSHKKKSSFSLKTLFKSPKSHKPKTTSHSKGSFEETRSAYNAQISSVENSPSQPSTQLRKFIFPANPIIHFESLTPTKNRIIHERSSNHYRSLSDFNQSSSGTNVAVNQHHIKEDKIITGRRLSLDSKSQTKSALQFEVLMGANQQKQEELNLHKKSNPFNKSTAGSAHNIADKADSIEMAISLRKEGKSIESANCLRRLCQTDNPTAFLLYGLALRDGCGVQKNYEESLRYIKAATGIESEENEIIRANIDPFELEKKESLPNIVPEPIAPALYECGMAYLKSLGLEKPDEIRGLKYLEKAASLGHIDSMCLSGTIWSKKSMIRKKDVIRAAAWFRLAEKRGAHLIGASWIHKDKYMNPLIANI